LGAESCLIIDSYWLVKEERPSNQYLTGIKALMRAVLIVEKVCPERFLFEYLASKETASTLRADAVFR
jgi:hypothetical protein